jgi:hypothetical protein
MDPRAKRLTTVEQCQNLAMNAQSLGAPELAADARKRALQIRAAVHGELPAVESECLQAVYAYEETLSAQKGKRQPASRTWQMIKRHGVVPAVERVVSRRQVSTGFTSLAEMGLREFAFEAVVLRHPKSFSSKAVEISRKRMEQT